MAKIVHSDLAPAEAVHYSFAGVEFDLGGSKKASYETDDLTVIANANAHPWLDVKVESKSVRAADAEADADDAPGVAIEAEGVAETFAADDSSKTSSKTTSKDKN